MPRRHRLGVKLDTGVEGPGNKPRHDSSEREAIRTKEPIYLLMWRNYANMAFSFQA